MQLGAQIWSIRTGELLTEHPFDAAVFAEPTFAPDDRSAAFSSGGPHPYVVALPPSWFDRLREKLP
ncbi:hypothetical protein R75461_07891 [Paraburkholderia nemoris]|nr:hypothetical protein R75461_07891 [Paraburkholderia nemoris]